MCTERQATQGARDTWQTEQRMVPYTLTRRLEPWRSWGWEGMGGDGKVRACPVKGAGQVLHQGWVCWVLGALFTFKPISRCFRNMSCHLPRPR